MASRSNVVSHPVTVSAVVLAIPGTYYGYTLRNASGVAAIVTIYDNASAASETILDTFGLAIGASASAFYNATDDTPGGIRASAGIYFSSDQTLVGSIRSS
jgi:hypothetical protein